jgi:hypothetical protein
MSVDFEEKLLGLTGGINLTKTDTVYTGRATILIIVFSIIALLGLVLNFMLDRSRKELAATAQKLKEEGEKEL